MKHLRPGEYAFLLLSSDLGDPGRKPLTSAQMRQLFQRARDLRRQPDRRDLASADIIQMGYSRAFADHVVALLSQEAELQYYLDRARKADCVPITRASEMYPAAIRQRLGLESPGVLWAKGDLSILQMPKVALVGSRDLQAENAAFAQEVGRQAARQGIALVSGNARGADKLAQNACLEAGGNVISVVADSLETHRRQENLLYLSENGFDEPFSAQRAISRNRCVHSLGAITFVAQARPQQGGTWDGTEKNLRFGWSQVYCYRDGSLAQRMLWDMGAGAVDMADLADLPRLQWNAESFFDQ
ncbi:MAG: DNA-processing protein DprA [Ruminococcaceae bacterium]|nr:DNA-processing protein DprA [Oscillospiraceae bacterium]